MACFNATRLNRWIFLSVSLTFAGPPVFAADLLVPAEYATIAAAISAAQPGNTVIIADGIYSGPGNQNLSFAGKAITVRSANGPENCIIHCDGPNTRGFSFSNGETLSSVLRGITIRNGMMQSGDGGGIICLNSSPLITECVFENNTTYFFGGGIHLENSSAVIAHCQFIGNIADNSISGLGAEGGGADCYGGGTPLFFNCLFIDNYAKSWGGGLNTDNSDFTAINCTFTNNQCSLGAGISARSADIHIHNCIIWDNSDEEVAFFAGTTQISHTCILRDNPWPGDGNIVWDPLLTAGPWGMGYLSSSMTGHPADSPCIDAGNQPADDLCEGEPSICLNALTTLVNHSTDSDTADMGFHFPISFPASFTPSLTPTATNTPIFSYTPAPPTATPTHTSPTSTPTQPTPTPTPIETNTQTPSPTPTDLNLGVYIHLSDTMFHAGTLFDLNVTIANPGPDEFLFQPLAIVLDLFGTFIWYPDWTESFQYDRVNVRIGELQMDVLEFEWPQVDGSVDGVIIYAALLTQELNAILGQLDFVSFGWEP